MEVGIRSHVRTAPSGPPNEEGCIVPLRQKRITALLLFPYDTPPNTGFQKPERQGRS